MESDSRPEGDSSADQEVFEREKMTTFRNLLLYFIAEMIFMRLGAL